MLLNIGVLDIMLRSLRRTHPTRNCYALEPVRNDRYVYIWSLSCAVQHPCHVM